ncbi:TldD/PmbA family protein [Parabacteroides sp. PF5-9]|uniref:TldD/PmbA family protein n=1 Tax=Parabacteroides sp. PF5-9 TaxID=1742404 RepID=UPI0024765941|nr:TldD/PmbA family protein [Parabacteroides sp. PF5-9]MDH6358830.1 PmbA protein [Parabacteroides sp. PF5-9]
MITNENKKLVQWAMDYALKNGCQASRISLYNGSNTSFEIRDMKIDKLQQASENSLSINLYVDGRFGSYSTNRLDKKELEKFIKDGIDATRYLAEDKARILPDPSLYYKGGNDDLELLDPAFDKVQPDDKVALAMSVCDEMMGKDERLISANSSYSDGRDFRYIIASNGFEGESSSSYFSLSSGASVRGDGDARPESYWYDASLYYDTLVKKGIGTTALERVLRKLGQKKVASGKYQMLVDNRNVSRLLSPVINALYGSSIQQKNSFLLNKQDEKIAGSNITIFDEPHLKKASGARYFDGEGVATKRMPVIENGILKTYYIDTYSSHKMNLKPTISSPSILTMNLGNRDLDGLITSVDKGILVTGFNGGNSNSTTGDFSYGVEGFLIEKGKLTQPVSEMNITGNMLTLWSNLIEAGNDPRLSSSWRLPSLLFDGVDFSGL